MHFLVGLTSALAVVTTFAGPAVAASSIDDSSLSPEIEWHSSVWGDREKQEPWQFITLTVPDQDTSVKTGANGLRLYDLHVAKMYAVTHYLCQHQFKPDKRRWWSSDSVRARDRLNVLAALLKIDRRNEGFNWFYEAGNGNVLMGQFKISCQAAQDVANQYGVKAAPPTLMSQTEQRPRPSDSVLIDTRVPKQYKIPELNLTAENISEWQDDLQKASPMRVSLDEDQRVPMARPNAGFTVPDQDTTLPTLAGGTLRQYDAHLGSIFAISHLLCQQGRVKHGIWWDYRAGSGDLPMGHFEISCRLAAEVASAYGVANSEAITIVDADRPYQTADHSGAVPTLKLTGAKVARWMDFTASFQPKKESWEIREDTFPSEPILPQLQGVTEVPILLPTKGISGHSFDVHVNKDGYSIGIYAGEGKCGVGCASGASWHGDINASRNTKAPEYSGESEFFQRNPRSRLRKIQLSHDTPAVFRSSCGAYCTASVRWQYQGVNYSVSGKGGQRSLVKIANSMIEAGPR
jgi:hypothetical protein